MNNKLTKGGRGWILITGSLFVTLVLLECLFFYCDRNLNINLFRLLEEQFAEEIYFHSDQQCSHRSAQFGTTLKSDHQLGWIELREALPSSSKPHRARIVVVGDSFTYGRGVAPSEVYARWIQSFFGENVDVINLGVPAYGIDQIALMTIKHGLPLAPDIILFGFISEDLQRSCLKFFAGNAKPYFRFSNEKLRLYGVPVPTPSELCGKHARLSRRVIDGLISIVLKSRIVRLFGQFFLQRAHQDCVERLNSELLVDLAKKVGKTKMVFVHLAGELPRGFLRNIREAGLEVFSLPSLVNQLATELGLNLDSVANGHPGPNRHHIYAEAIYRHLREQDFAPRSVEDKN